MSPLLTLASVLTSFGVVVLTAIYVVLTSRITRQNKEALVISQIVPDEHHFNVFNFEVLNAGPSTARLINGTFSPNVKLKTGVHLSDLYGTIPVLAPGQRVRTVLFAAVDSAYIDAEFPQRTLSTTFKWRDGSSRKLRQWTTTERVDRLFGTGVIDPTTPLEEAVSDLADIAKMYLEEHR